MRALIDQGGPQTGSWAGRAAIAPVGQASRQASQKVQGPLWKSTSGNPPSPVTMIFSGQASRQSPQRVQREVNSRPGRDQGGRTSARVRPIRPLSRPRRLIIGWPYVRSSAIAAPDPSLPRPLWGPSPSVRKSRRPRAREESSGGARVDGRQGGPRTNGAYSSAGGRQGYVTAQARSVEAPRIEEIPENLLRVPIDYLYADHYRQRTMWAMLDALVVDPCSRAAPRSSAVLLTYLERDLPRHIADEEEDLFPRLKARALPEDGVADVLALLSEEHVEAGRLLPPLVAALRLLAAGAPLADERAFARDATLFAAAQRRHQAWENRIVMPVARKRLTRDDLAEIGRNMAARRGIAFPE